MKKILIFFFTFASFSVLGNCCINPSPGHCTYSLAYQDKMDKKNPKESKRIFFLVDQTGLKVNVNGKPVECTMKIDDALPGPTCSQCPKCKHDMATHVCDEKSNIIDPEQLK